MALFLSFLVSALFALNLVAGDNSDQMIGDEEESVRIVGGDRAKRGEHPWLVRLYYWPSTDYPAFRCGGSILDEKTILTAAHCIDDDPDQNIGVFVVEAGDHHLFKNESTEQYIIVRNIIVHKKYNKKSTFDRDIAVLKLENPLEMTEFVQSIRMAEKSQEKMLLYREGHHCVVAGVGHKNMAGQRPLATKEVRVTMKRRKSCQRKAEKYEPNFTRFMLCAKQRFQGFCYGDSGGPLVCFDETSEPFQVGIVSWLNRDCWLGFNVYVRVPYLKGWTERYLER